MAFFFRSFETEWVFATGLTQFGRGNHFVNAASHPQSRPLFELKTHFPMWNACVVELWAEGLKSQFFVEPDGLGLGAQDGLVELCAHVVEDKPHQLCPQPGSTMGVEYGDALDFRLCAKRFYPRRGGRYFIYQSKVVNAVGVFSVNFLGLRHVLALNENQPPDLKAGGNVIRTRDLGHVSASGWDSREHAVALGKLGLPRGEVWTAHAPVAVGVTEIDIGQGAADGYLANVQIVRSEGAHP